MYPSVIDHVSNTPGINVGHRSRIEYARYKRWAQGRIVYALHGSCIGCARHGIDHVSKRPAQTLGDGVLHTPAQTFAVGAYCIRPVSITYCIRPAWVTYRIRPAWVTYYICPAQTLGDPVSNTSGINVGRRGVLHTPLCIHCAITYRTRPALHRSRIRHARHRSALNTPNIDPHVFQQSGRIQYAPTIK